MTLQNESVLGSWTRSFLQVRSGPMRLLVSQAGKGAAAKIKSSIHRHSIKCWLIVHVWYKPTSLFQRRSDNITCATINWCWRTKNSQHENWKHYTAKMLMDLGGFYDTESISTVRSNFARFCDSQTAFMWLLRARWTVVINLELIDSFSMVENTPQPKWTQLARSFWCPEIAVEALECRRLAINLTIRITW